ncbi:hypothetical protein H074_14917 [Amycolatopsis decaplanina DSM 44594]|uniref:Secreted protein n=1 Tax=Amycolatopsis decaplanina DSM 44594 TaxID=1284240 RepID=M2ZHD2_9PSEU|nr:hypothetical protein H074_14917 [Amycolatopsis decaplanina DSM 44594]
MGVLALGFAGFAATASAAPATSFEVCSPLGCAAQSVRGLVDRGQLVVTVSDSSPVSALTARFAVSPQGGMTQVIVDDGVRRASIRLPNGSAQLIVTACGGGGCNSKSIPL